MSNIVHILRILLLTVFADNVLSIFLPFDSLDVVWTTWKTHHKRTYALQEETLRMAIFTQNYQRIKQFNSENEDTQLALNKFADLTAEEFRAQHSSCAFSSPARTSSKTRTFISSEKALPPYVDWREQGAVTPVKDQGKCGACWAFSTTGAIEGLYYTINQELVSFSEQQIIDCDPGPNDQGCYGGWPQHGIEYASDHGLETEDDYPYVGKAGTCKFDSNKAKYAVDVYSTVQQNSSIALKEAVTVSPVSVLIEADEKIFQFYKSGVVYSRCGSLVNHAALVVGYKRIGLLEAFIVKNSWGSDWGDEGYIYISTDGRVNDGLGVCGILYSPILASMAGP